MHKESHTTANQHAYLVGSGIASLAAAAYLIRDGGMPGENIHILEECALPGGALDGSGNPDQGYVIRGGRMLNTPAYEATYNLLSFIPSLDNPGDTVLDDIQGFNAKIRSHSRSRLVASGARKVNVASMGFSWNDRRDLATMMARPEASFGTSRIDESFSPEFFDTAFWYIWCTTFAFQPWHSAVEFKRYLHRFLHEFPRISTLAGVDRTPLNQYDSIIRPLVSWLTDKGVHLDYQTRVVDMDIASTEDTTTVQRIHLTRKGQPEAIDIHPDDIVFVTIGSMTADSSLGSMTEPAPLITDLRDGAWTLWERLADGRPQFGNPANFIRRIDESKWFSFTCTFREPTFFQRMQDFTTNRAGTGGLVTFKDSNWLMSIVLAHQPHFSGQPADVHACWGYGLFPDKIGNHVRKPLSDCTGADILTELCGHLHFDDVLPDLLATSTVIPCQLPYITSQFLTRTGVDRPQVVPAGSRNLAFLGQFCEIPDDVVFTVDYSVRSAEIAVATLLGLDRRPTPIYKGENDIQVLLASLVTSLA